MSWPGPQQRRRRATRWPPNERRATKGALPVSVHSPQPPACFSTYIHGTHTWPYFKNGLFTQAHIGVPLSLSLSACDVYCVSLSRGRATRARARASRRAPCRACRGAASPRAHPAPRLRRRPGNHYSIRSMYDKSAAPQRAQRLYSLTLERRGHTEVAKGDTTNTYRSLAIADLMAMMRANNREQSCWLVSWFSESAPRACQVSMARALLRK